MYVYIHTYIYTYIHIQTHAHAHIQDNSIQFHANNTWCMHVYAYNSTEFQTILYRSTHKTQKKTNYNNEKSISKKVKKQ